VGPPGDSAETEQRRVGGIIAFIVLGFLAGAIAKAVLPGNDPGGFIVMTIIGAIIPLAIYRATVGRRRGLRT
jgi:uncharacterized membrane protein YeaQ/YmgE (transglycosylase-associated protein family)